MKTKISEADFDRIIAQAGLKLSAEQKRELHAAYWIMEDLIERVNAPLPPEVEPAHLFTAEEGR
jgi:hypothetical protein